MAGFWTNAKANTKTFANSNRKIGVSCVPNVPATRSTLVVLLKVLTQGEAVTEGCSPDQVTITMNL